METKTFNLETLSSLTGLPRRTIRYYIQIGLVDRPEGEGRGAYYAERHLGELLEIKNLTAQGLSLEAIRARIKGEPVEKPPLGRPAFGTTTVKSHIQLGPGLELIVDPAEMRLGADAIRFLAREIINLVQKMDDDRQESEKSSPKDPSSGDSP
jgi:DNA-binding transcriptional MerR regulator